MEIIKVDNAAKNKLYISLDSYIRSFMKRSVTISVVAHSGKVAIIDIQVNGKQGIGRKQVVVTFEEFTGDWIATSDGEEYRMVLLSDIKIVVKNKINKLITILTKI